MVLQARPVPQVRTLTACVEFLTPMTHALSAYIARISSIWNVELVHSLTKWVLQSTSFTQGQLRLTGIFATRLISLEKQLSPRRMSMRSVLR